jgi:hypothetical protein
MKELVGYVVEGYYFLIHFLLGIVMPIERFRSEKIPVNLKQLKSSANHLANYANRSTILQ